MNHRIKSITNFLRMFWANIGSNECEGGLQIWGECFKVWAVARPGGDYKLP